MKPGGADNRKKKFYGRVAKGALVEAGTRAKCKDLRIGGPVHEFPSIFFPEKLRGNTHYGKYLKKIVWCYGKTVLPFLG